MSYTYVMIYTCKEALFTLSVKSHAQNLNRNNADTGKVKYLNNSVSFQGKLNKITLE